MSRNQKQFIEEEIKPIKYRNCLYRMKLAQYDVEVNCTKKVPFFKRNESILKNFFKIFIFVKIYSVCFRKKDAIWPHKKFSRY